MNLIREGGMRVRVVVKNGLVVSTAEFWVGEGGEGLKPGELALYFDLYSPPAP